VKVLITGSNGFIGRWVTERLDQEGHETIGLDRTERIVPGRGTFFRCDLLDLQQLEAAFVQTRPDAVVHLAGRVDLQETRELAGYAANIDGVRNLIAAIRAAGSVRRAIYTSSQLVCRIGYIPRGPEDYCPDTLYGESKVNGSSVNWTEVEFLGA
jgi:GlcNAc-P-P-Und epimerase